MTTEREHREAERLSRQFENTARDYLRVLAIENAIYSSADKGMRLDLPQDADD